MLHPGEMNPKDCAGEKQQDLSQGSQLSQKSSAVAWKTWFEMKMTERENQTGTRAGRRWEPDDHQPTALVVIV